jgi:hypothetical protein
MNSLPFPANQPQPQAYENVVIVVNNEPVNIKVKVEQTTPEFVDNAIVPIDQSSEKKESKKRKREPKVPLPAKETPTIQNARQTKHLNYCVAELKEFLKANQLKVSGNKQELHDRLFGYLLLTGKITRAQAVFRGWLVRSVYSLFDKYQKMVADCVNDQDFYSFEPLNEINKFQLICMKEQKENGDGPVYGFDISSIYQYKKKLGLGTELTNPYNRNTFPPSFFAELSKIACSAKMGLLPTVLDIEPDVDVNGLSFEKKVDLRALALFQHINSLGNYSDASWFLQLARRRIIQMIQELYDIWRHRLNISESTKRSICPPHGNPFGSLISVSIREMTDKELQNLVLGIFENFVYRGVDRDAQCLGAFYVLGALTIVSSVAAEAAPWLYQSFVY